MPRADNRYSQFVAAAKIILPLAGLGLLSSLFLISGADQSGTDIPFSEIELEEIVEGQRILSPRYQTVLANGAQVDFTAQSAKPDLSNTARFTASELIVRIDQPDGLRIDLRGAEGTLDNDARTVRVEGGLRLARSDGFTLSTEGAEARLDGLAGHTTGEAIILGPGVTLNAGRAEVIFDTETSTQRIVFTQGVKLIYTPQ